ncbi:glycosyltransferase family 4 protein [Parendozoicomonas sp. Alg238-R29]|uniref:glycosyltransferase family 4 protein n=1 Tax=Parendozoicomonas sp. Alg238-R29 TaxID=2993446 RepID=UPI00248F0382|nr:glycosyltransferase family 4 protein [Parendozoicomonas sp. Alg238-R29]
MALFGTVLPADKGVLDGYINGLREANSSFLISLIRYSDFFDQFHFFAAEGDVEARQMCWDQWLETEQLEKTVQVFPVELLPASFAASNYDLFYSGDPYLSYLLELRDAFASQPFPIVGRTHALSQDITLGVWKNLLLSPSQSYDSILCSSQASIRVVGNLLEEAGVRVGKEFHGSLKKMPLGVEALDSSVGQNRAREALGLPEGGIIILCLGRLSPVDKSDLHPLLRAFADLYDRYGQENCYLYICGQASADDDYVTSLVNLAGQLAIESQVLFNFDLAHEDKHLAFNAADIFVSLADSVQESFGIAPVEAMSAGIPVVLSDWNGYRELITHSQEGLLVPTVWGDVDGLIAPGAYFEPGKAQLAQAQSVAICVSSLSANLNTLVSDSSLRKKMGVCGQERYKQNYACKNVIREFDVFSRELATQAREDVVQPSGKLKSLHYGRVFKGYEYEEINSGQLLKTSLAGRQMLSGIVAPVCLDALGMILPVQHLPFVLKACLTGCAVETVRSSSGMARAQTDMLILWALKHDLLVRRDSPELSGAALQVRYQKSRNIYVVRVLNNIYRRVLECRTRFSSVFGIQGALSTIKPLSEKGYGGACRISFSCGGNLVYKPVDMRLEEALVKKSGLSGLFNSGVGRPVFAEGGEILFEKDRRGRYGFRRYLAGDKISPSTDMKALGYLSAFVLLTGMSDAHLDNFLVCEDKIHLLDAEMVCYPEVLERLSAELSNNILPESWLQSSLSLTRIEILWDNILAQGWMPEGSDVDAVISGFEQGLRVFQCVSDQWRESMLRFAELPCRIDPVPFNSADPIIEQVKALDLQALNSLSELKADIRVQARRVLRQLGVGAEQQTIERLVRSWMKGQHLVDYLVPDSKVKERIRSISSAMSDERSPDTSFAIGSSWLAVLYREWLMERCGLD